LHEITLSYEHWMYNNRYSTLSTELSKNWRCFNLFLLFEILDDLNCKISNFSLSKSTKLIGKNIALNSLVLCHSWTFVGVLLTSQIVFVWKTRTNIIFCCIILNNDNS
jgi:hypothetical protein